MVNDTFCTYWEARHLGAGSLANKIISCLEKYGLKYREYKGWSKVGKGCTGAAIMSLINLVRFLDSVVNNGM